MFCPLPYTVVENHTVRVAILFAKNQTASRVVEGADPYGVVICPAVRVVIMFSQTSNGTSFFNVCINPG